VWLKTTNNCYISETCLADPINRFTLANCGMIGFLQANYTGDYDVGNTAKIRKAFTVMVIQRSAESESGGIPLPNRPKKPKSVQTI
jgi:hypothetical protein